MRPGTAYIRGLPATHPSPDAVAVGRALVTAAAGGGKPMTTGHPPRAPRWPSPFPYKLLTVYLTSVGRCWTCGSSFKAGRADRQPPECSSCSVAVFASHSAKPTRRRAAKWKLSARGAAVAPPNWRACTLTRGTEGPR